MAQKQKLQSSPPSLEAFQALVASKAPQARNIAALGDLDIWLYGILSEKLGEEPSDDPRGAKIRAWTGSVARKRMARDGALRPALPEELALLAKDELWVDPAIKAGKTLSLLRLESDEGDQLRSALDWMRSPSGPAVDADWTRISWPQAVEAHHRWVEALTRAARKNMEQGAAFEGCELLAPVTDTPELDGWTWVEVGPKKALDREGALMKHCVGSYAKDVAAGKSRIASLRDPKGAPHVTVEAQPGAGEASWSISQIRGAANSIPKPLHMAAVPSLVEGWKTALGAKVSIPSRLLGPAANGLGYAPDGFGESGKLWRAGHPADARAAMLAAQACAESAPVGDLLRIEAFMDGHGYEAALAQFLKAPRPRLARLMQEAVDEHDRPDVGVPPGVSRADLLALRDLAMERGLPHLARASLAALRELPAEQYASARHHEVEIASLDRFEQCKDLIDAMAGEFKTLLGKKRTGTVQEISIAAARESKMLPELGALLGCARDRTVYACCGYLVALLPKEIGQLRKHSAEPQPGERLVSDLYRSHDAGAGPTPPRAFLPMDMRKELALILYQAGDFDETGREALISPMSGYGSLDPKKTAALWATDEADQLAALASAAAMAPPAPSPTPQVASKLKARARKASAPKDPEAKPSA